MRGGKREGAGRKPTGRITKTIRVDPELWAYLGESATRADTSASDRLDAILRQARAGERRRIRERQRRASGQPARTRTPQDTPALPKIGRNDPCPCRSGKKFKKCCMRGL